MKAKLLLVLLLPMFVWRCACIFAEGYQCNDCS